ncbi:oligopeptide ABC transporter ATP-binding protein, partial [Acinetobacter baumannii]
MSPPSGFRFSTRCPFAFDCCQQEEPSLQADEDDRTVACHLYDLPDA